MITRRSVLCTCHSRREAHAEANTRSEQHPPSCRDRRTGTRCVRLRRASLHQTRTRIVVILQVDRIWQVGLCIIERHFPPWHLFSRTLPAEVVFVTLVADPVLRYARMI
jgi:hypothetical protein